MKLRAVTVLASAMVTAAFQVGALDESELETLYGQGDPLCDEVRGRLIAMDSNRFTMGEWRQDFELRNWTSAMRTFTTTQGLKASTPLQFIRVDLDKDGISEVAVLTVFSIKGRDFDWLSVFNEAEFQVLQESVDSTRLLSDARTLNLGNVVYFSDGQWGIPNELGLWEWHEQVYLLLKEGNFAQHAYDALDDFFVAQFEKQFVAKPSENPRDRRLSPKLVCRFVAQ